MKTLFKWAAIFTLPSVVAFLYMMRTFPDTTPEVQAAFITIHYMSAGVAAFFVLRELNRSEKKSEEKFGILRYMITGILTVVAQGMIFGLFSATYFNVINPDLKEAYIQEELIPGFVRGKDSTANNLEEYYSHLMQGADSAVLLPERYQEIKQAAEDSVLTIQNLVIKVEHQNFSYYGTLIRFVGMAPIFGILFSVIIVVYLKR
ncbi:MAG: DUF4199 family protein [Bacteroidetes bacterium]|nr:DUF4199 family protein [Bacteroidota bacterium]